MPDIFIFDPLTTLRTPGMSYLIDVTTRMGSTGESGPGCHVLGKQVQVLVELNFTDTGCTQSWAVSFFVLLLLDWLREWTAFE